VQPPLVVLPTMMSEDKLEPADIGLFDRNH
jgi:hypothetical protein